MDTIENKLLDIRRKIALIENDNIELLEFKNLGYTNWLIKNNEPIMYNENEKKFEVDLSRDQVSYISYYEPNFDYKKTPNHKLIDLLSMGQFTVQFSGEIDDTLKCTLEIIEYENEYLVNIHEIPINNNKLINISQETDAIRLLIKVEGYGTFNIDELIIGQKNYWYENSFVTKDGYLHFTDKNWIVPQCNELTYDKEIDAFSINTEKPLYLIYGNEPASKFNTKELLDQDSVEKLFVNFSGDLFSSDLTVELFIIAHEENKINEYKVSLNDTKTIYIPKETSHFSLKIKVVGSGLVSIHNIFISGFNFWPKKKEYSSLARYSREKTDYFMPITIDNVKFQFLHRNKITLNKWNDNFYSDLEDNQSVILKIKDYNNFIPINNKTYEFNPTVNKSPNIKLFLLIKIEDVNSQKQIYSVPFNSVRYIQISNVRDVSFFIKIQGSGNFSNMNIFINEQETLITQSIDLNLNANEWFAGNNVELSLTDILSGKAEIPIGENRYISYKEKNSSFNLLPTHNLIRINSGNFYVFNIRGKFDKTLQLIPMVIAYDDDKKVGVYSLKINSKNKIKFKDNVKRIRLAIRLSGEGEFSITSANIYETPVLDLVTNEAYSNKYEVEQLEILPRKKLKEIKLAAIVDEFTAAAFKKECEFIQFTPQNWLETLSREQPDLLFVESAWRGYKGTWTKKVGDYGEENNRELFELIEWCKKNNIPTVFWNKEDPVHFSRFIEIAKRFDYVFTTDENMVPEYIKRVGHENVGSLPFAAQPLIHNPIKLTDPKKNKTCFAGSYYHHHKERSKDMNTLLDAASEFGLDIYDRNYEKTSKGLMPNHTFPERFKPYIKGSLKYYEIDKAYKGYKVSMNVNTVKNSDTMFSRRVFESLACGTPVVSNYSKGIVKMLGDFITASDDFEELKEAFNKLLNDEHTYECVSLLGMREVLTKHTYSDRLKKILDSIGIKTMDESPKITVIGIANSSEDFTRIITSFNNQNYKNKELYILTEIFDGYIEFFDKYNTRNIKTFIKSYVEKNYSNISELVNSKYICYFDNEDFYGENYLLDLSLAIKYTNADFIGKQNYFKFYNDKLEEINRGSSFEFVSSINSTRTIVKTVALNTIPLQELLSTFTNREEFNNFTKTGKLLFSCDKFNYIEHGYNLKENHEKLKEIQI